MENTEFLSIDKEFKMTSIGRSIIMREQEIFAYEMNINVYNVALNDPTISRDHRETLNDLIRSEHREREKCLVILNGLKAQLPELDIPKAIAMAKDAKNV